MYIEDMCYCCCCCFFLIALVLICCFTSLSFYAMIILAWGFWGLVYLGGIGGYITLFSWIIYCLHQSGIEILKLKQQRKFIRKGEACESNMSTIVSHIVGNLVFLVISVLLFWYFPVWYVKYPLVMYISIVLGYIACFPLPEETADKIINNYYGQQDELIITTALNTAIFLGMYLLYAFAF